MDYTPNRRAPQSPELTKVRLLLRALVRYNVNRTAVNDVSQDFQVEDEVEEGNRHSSDSSYQSQGRIVDAAFRQSALAGKKESKSF